MKASNNLVITIDGLAINGKTTLARMLASNLNIKYYDSGAVYRCIALYILENNLDINNLDEILPKIESLKIDFIGDDVYLNGENVSDLIRIEEISFWSTKWATFPEIKKIVRKFQKSFIIENDTIMEGRDIATRIAPDADIKFYLYSDFEVRVDRLFQKYQNIPREELSKNIKIRDDLDIYKGNFVYPKNTFEIDTTNYSIEELYEIMMNEINKKLKEKNDLDKIKNQIINNPEYLNWMEIIDELQKEFASSSEFNNSVALDHGICHMNRIALNIYKLMVQYGSNKEDCYLGFIAALIHDIGMIHGKKGHAHNGSIMAEDFLKKLDFLDQEQIEKIVHAIDNHGNGENAVNDIDIFLALADKLDIVSTRYLGNSSPIQYITNYTFNIEDKTLKLYYEISDDFGIESFYIIPKTIDVPTELAKKLGLNIKFYINGREETFESRKDFKGKIYKQ